MDNYCEHDDCRKDTVAELLWLSPLFRRTTFKELAERTMRSQVRCRHVPRARDVPLAPRHD